MSDEIWDLPSPVVEYMMSLIDTGHSMLDVTDNSLEESFHLLERSISDSVDVIAKNLDVDPDAFMRGMGEGFTRSALAIRGLLLAYEARSHAA
jgi:hypothetical protein